MFDIAERLGFVSLSMWDGIAFIKRNVLGEGDIDFMGKQGLCFALSSAAIVIGMLAVAVRGKEILNIDFTGGTSVTFQLQEPIKADELRDLTRSFLTTDENGEYIQSSLVRVEKKPLDTVYTLVTSIKDRRKLQEILVNGFAKNEATKLVTYSVQVVGDPKSTSTSSALPRGKRSLCGPSCILPRQSGSSRSYGRTSQTSPRACC